MNCKRRFALVLAAALCLSQLTLAASAAQYPGWAEIAMERWEECGKLDPAFGAEHVMTGGEASAMIGSVFASWKADENTAAITRQEAAVMVAQAFGLHESGSAEYTDASEISASAMDAVFTLQKLGIMQGNSGTFRPNATITYAEMLVLLNNALEKTSTLTGLEAHARHKTGVLAQGQPAQCNDGKFEVVSVTQIQDGYRVEVRGLAPLVGQQANADGEGAPAKAGKWMGIQLKLSGLFQVGGLQYNDENASWLVIGDNDAFAEEHRADSVMVYLSGTADNSADGKESEKTTTLYIRNAYGGDKIAVEFHYTPAQP